MKISTFRRACFGAASALALMAGAAAAAPERPECVAPAQPGGGFDLTCRIAAEALESQLPTPMQVTFLPGGIGAVAFNQFNTTRTDDPNAIVAFSTGSLLNIATGKYGEFTQEDVRWVAAAGTDYGAVIVKADSEFETLQDVMDAFAADPGSVVTGAGGSVGSQDWMKAALLVQAAGADPRAMRYVAFDGGGESIAGLLGGSIQIYTGDVAEMVPHLEAGTMRILGIMSAERLPAPFAEIPTVTEQGWEIEWPILRGFYMGKDVSDEDYNAYVEMFEAAYETPEFAELQAERGLFPLNMAGEEFHSSVLERTERLQGLAQEFGLIQE
ncbi:Bug family tripartite tricarboxylate transporter substrate binding protein [Paracoccus aerodenitrificans]|uniref:Bug family tripartite tricarboxylate transporter substrate binding protein n=1 Tax=Paracoccus aerodenitrificans TaxID=3017781 RepID=UPI0022F07B13|nr:tripartite tricarboxylate transporter substrate-binding protein [Paracoccus aerodenitrificans]WBU64137.1 tripartite tricarboxylate transporter substrate-binding protein [Paracoccus aerodenitrificans]